MVILKVLVLRGKYEPGVKYWRRDARESAFWATIALLRR